MSPNLNIGSMRAGIFVCFIHSWTPSLTNRPGTQLAQSIFYEWLNENESMYVVQCKHLILYLGNKSEEYLPSDLIYIMIRNTKLQDIYRNICDKTSF